MSADVERNEVDREAASEEQASLTSDASSDAKAEKAEEAKKEERKNKITAEKVKLRGLMELMRILIQDDQERAKDPNYSWDERIHVLYDIAYLAQGFPFDFLYGGDGLDGLADDYREPGNKRSIWRDLAYLLRVFNDLIFTTEADDPFNGCYDKLKNEFGEGVIKNIFEKDFDGLDGVLDYGIKGIDLSLKSKIGEQVSRKISFKRWLRDSYFLPNVYAIANWWRDRKNLEELDQIFLFAQDLASFGGHRPDYSKSSEEQQKYIIDKLKKPFNLEEWSRIEKIAEEYTTMIKLRVVSRVDNDVESWLKKKCSGTKYELLLAVYYNKETKKQRENREKECKKDEKFASMFKKITQYRDQREQRMNSLEEQLYWLLDSCKKIFKQFNKSDREVIEGYLLVLNECLFSIAGEQEIDQERLFRAIKEYPRTSCSVKAFVGILRRCKVLEKIITEENGKLLVRLLENLEKLCLEGYQYAWHRVFTIGGELLHSRNFSDVSRAKIREIAKEEVSKILAIEVWENKIFKDWKAVPARWFRDTETGIVKVKDIYRWLYGIDITITEADMSRLCSSEVGILGGAENDEIALDLMKINKLVKNFCEDGDGCRDDFKLVIKLLHLIRANFQRDGLEDIWNRVRCVWLGKLHDALVTLLVDYITNQEIDVEELKKELKGKLKKESGVMDYLLFLPPIRLRDVLFHPKQFELREIPDQLLVDLVYNGKLREYWRQLRIYAESGLDEQVQKEILTGLTGERGSIPIVEGKELAPKEMKTIKELFFEVYFKAEECLKRQMKGDSSFWNFFYDRYKDMKLVWFCDEKNEEEIRKSVRKLAEKGIRATIREKIEKGIQTAIKDAIRPPINSAIITKITVTTLIDEAIRDKSGEAKAKLHNMIVKKIADLINKVVDDVIVEKIEIKGGTDAITESEIEEREIKAIEKTIADNTEDMIKGAVVEVIGEAIGMPIGGKNKKASKQATIGAAEQIAKEADERIVKLTEILNVFYDDPAKKKVILNAIQGEICKTEIENKIQEAIEFREKLGTAIDKLEFSKLEDLLKSLKGKAESKLVKGKLVEYIIAKYINEDTTLNQLGLFFETASKMNSQEGRVRQEGSRKKADGADKEKIGYYKKLLKTHLDEFKEVSKEYLERKGLIDKKSPIIDYRVVDSVLQNRLVELSKKSEEKLSEVELRLMVEIKTLEYLFSCLYDVFPDKQTGEWRDVRNFINHGSGIIYSYAKRIGSDSMLAELIEVVEEAIVADKESAVGRQKAEMPQPEKEKGVSMKKGGSTQKLTIEGRQYQVVPAFGDGSCFFHAMEEQLRVRYQVDIDYQELRRIAVGKLREDEPRYLGWLLEDAREGYVDVMRTDREWADHPIIQALADDMFLEIIIYERDDSGGGRLYQRIVPTQGEAQATVYLLYNGVHYDSLEFIEGVSVPDPNSTSVANSTETSSSSPVLGSIPSGQVDSSVGSSLLPPGSPTVSK